MVVNLLKNHDFALAVDLTYYYPHLMALAFLAGLYSTTIPAKKRFAVRVLWALVIALFLAHMNRLFNLWPAHLYFASGHMTFSLGMAISLGLLQPWTLLVTLPLLVPFGIDLVLLHFHLPEDVIGAIPIVAVVYGLVDRFWSLSPYSRPLDSAAVSP